MIRRLADLLQLAETRLGFRSSRLVIFGVIWVCIGLSTLAEPLPTRGAQAMLLHEHIPLPVRGGAWMLTGAIAVATGLRRRHDDSLAWALLTVMPTVRLLSWGFSWLAWCLTTALHQILGVPVLGLSGGLTAAFIYLAVLALVSSSARHRCSEQLLIPPPPRIPPRPEPSEPEGDQ